MIRAVIDTNIFVSGLRNLNGNEARIVDAVRAEVLQPCLSEEIFEEYFEVLTRRKFGFLTEDVAVLLTSLRRTGRFFQPDPVTPVAPDPSDAKFMACAVIARAYYLVTGNKRHFPDQFYGSARVVNARELLERIASGA